MFQELFPVSCLSLPLEREAAAGRATGTGDIVVLAATAGGWVWVFVLVGTLCEQQRLHLSSAKGSRNCRTNLWARGWCLQLVNASRAGCLARNPRRLSVCLSVCLPARG